MELHELEASLAADHAWDSLEQLVTATDGFGLQTATPVQRAVCWVLQNNSVPDHLWVDHTVQEAFGGVRPSPSSPHQSREVLILAGVRGGKTLICAAACVWFALRVDLSIGVGQFLKKGEKPRVSLVSASVDNAKEAYNYIRGAMQESPSLAPMLVGEPKRDWLTVRHPSGRHIDIKVVAMSGRQGVNLVSRWSAGVLFDEAPRMAADDADGKINLDGMVRGVRARMLPGSPIMYIGSPVGAVGYVYNLFQNNFGKTDARITVVKAQGRWLNPVHWTPERIAALKDNPKTYDEYLTDAMAEFRDVETQMFSSAMVDRSTRAEPTVLAPEEGRTYTAVMDAATRNNAWTLLVAETDNNIRFRVVLAMQWQGSSAQPLHSPTVLKETKDVLQPYRLTSVMADQWAVDPIRDIAREVGLDVVPSPFSGLNKTKRYLAVETRLNAGFLELPPVPEVRDDMLNVKKLILSNGDVKIRLVETENGRHCDFASCLALLCGGYLEESDVEANQRRAGELPTEDEELFQAEDSPAVVAQRDWDGLDERGAEQGANW